MSLPPRPKPCRANMVRWAMKVVSKQRNNKTMQTTSNTSPNGIYYHRSVMASYVYCNHSTVCQTEKVKVCRVEKAVHSVPKITMSLSNNITTSPCLQFNQIKNKKTTNNDGHLSTINTQLCFCDKTII